MRRFDVPGDNHCLFYSIYFLMNEGVLEKSKARQLRATVGQYVMQPSSSFTELVLGKPQDDYAAWIQSNNSWGGAVEVKIFSNLYRVEIHAVDIMTGRIDKYNGGKYQQKIFLLYDGIHYDPLYWEFEEQGLPKQTAFQSDDMTSELGAVEIARVLQGNFLVPFCLMMIVFSCSTIHRCFKVQHKMRSLREISRGRQRSRFTCSRDWSHAIRGNLMLSLLN